MMGRLRRGAGGRTGRWLVVGMAAVSAVGPLGALAQDDGSPLHIRVRPSGYEQPPRETLEQKVARRTREEFRFRSICRGCLPANVEARLDALRDPSPLLRGPAPDPAPAGAPLSEEVVTPLAARPDAETMPIGDVSQSPAGGIHE